MIVPLASRSFILQGSPLLADMDAFVCWPKANLK
jgi:hypothetical protein